MYFMAQPWLIGFNGEANLFGNGRTSFRICPPLDRQCVEDRNGLLSQRLRRWLKESLRDSTTRAPGASLPSSRFPAPIYHEDMRAYIIRRLLLIVPSLFILSMLVFLSVRFIPGDAIDAMLGKQGFIGAEVDREALEHMLGLDVPVHVQYARWIGGILRHGSLGHSLLGSRGAVEEKIIDRLPVTIELGALAILIGLAIALPVGIYSAMRQDTAADYVGRSVAIIGLATPNFWLATMVVLYPSTLVGMVAADELGSFQRRPAGEISGC